MYTSGGALLLSHPSVAFQRFFSLSLSLSRDFLGEIIKTAGPMQHQNLFYLFLFIFCVFDSVGRHGHPRIIYSDREFSLYIQKWYL
jgi:hypothetical protein